MYSSDILLTIYYTGTMINIEHNLDTTLKFYLVKGQAKKQLNFMSEESRWYIREQTRDLVKTPIYLQKFIWAYLYWKNYD